MADVSPALRAELAPTGTLRVGLNMSNFLLTGTDSATKTPRGVAVDLGNEIARRLGVPVTFVPYPSPGALADGATAGAWDVGFLGAEPQRAKEINFSPAYVEIEATYLVQPGSSLKTPADVDKPGIRIITNERAAYELWLTDNLKHATLVREKGTDNTFKRFVEDKFDALAGLRPRLVTDAEKLPGSRVLDGRFTAVQQAIGTPKARVAGAKFLSEFAEDVKASGLVARLIEKNGVRGLSVAAAA